jgi:2-dehydropantoate 2-reductase
MQFPFKIGVVGPGAVGSYYGAKLARAGHSVHFLLRSDYGAVRRHGVRVSSPEGDFEVHPKLARSPEGIGVCDLVLIALKTTANDQFPRLLPPLIGPHTAILTLQNGLGNEEALERLFPVDQILGGLCFVCLNRTSPGQVLHLAHGKIELGEHRRYPEPRTHDISGAFRHAGVPCAVRDNLERAHWEKLVWNIPFNGLSTASFAGLAAFDSAAPVARRAAGLTTDQLLADDRWLALVQGLMREILAVSCALGFPIPDAFAEKQIANTRIMSAYKPSTMIDFERAQPIELDALFLEPLRRARAANVPTPHLERLVTVLQKLDESLVHRET